MPVIRLSHFTHSFMPVIEFMVPSGRAEGLKIYIPLKKTIIIADLKKYVQPGQLRRVQYWSYFILLHEYCNLRRQEAFLSIYNWLLEKFLSFTFLQSSGNNISVVTWNNILEHRQLISFFLLERIANHLKSLPVSFFETNLLAWQHLQRSSDLLFKSSF